MSDLNSCRFCGKDADHRNPLHAALSILDAGSRGQWPPKTYTEQGGDRSVRAAYESILCIYNNWNRRTVDVDAVLSVAERLPFAFPRELAGLAEELKKAVGHE